MRILVLALSVALFFSNAFAQHTIESTLDRFNEESVPYISISEMKSLEEILILDTRELEEFKVSRIPGAIWVGHDTFTMEQILADIPDKTKPIVVYCSVGVRSENIGEKLQKAGYSDVKNLYGGIFQWMNENNTVVNENGNPTERVHAFNQHWGKLLLKGERVYNTKSNTIAPKNQ
ncbi:MAG: rhodanese-like domain-containing protein [Bacteroidota bacterium]